MGSTPVYSAIFLLDSAAVALAVVAETRRSTATVVSDPHKLSDQCVYDSDISTGLGIGAFVFLLVSQILLMTVTRCLCCGQPLRRSGARTCAKILFFISWLTFAGAEACLLAGSVRNAYHTRFHGTFQMKPLDCQTLRRGIFAAGAVFAFATEILTILYYHSYSKACHDGSGTYKDVAFDMVSLSR